MPLQAQPWSPQQTPQQHRPDCRLQPVVNIPHRRLLPPLLLPRTRHWAGWPLKVEVAACVHPPSQLKRMNEPSQTGRCQYQPPSPACALHCLLSDAHCRSAHHRRGSFCQTPGQTRKQCRLSLRHAWLTSLVRRGRHLQAGIRRCAAGCCECELPVSLETPVVQVPDARCGRRGRCGGCPPPAACPAARPPPPAPPPLPTHAPALASRGASPVRGWCRD
mmetsp:Transcript_17456/g.52373  ORF Transcript_17456/g.52373 Transcript_17456/m.52373 type:complete len:219 (-) Transcript_17456:224-880(-)